MLSLDIYARRYTFSRPAEVDFSAGRVGGGQDHLHGTAEGEGEAGVDALEGHPGVVADVLVAGQRFHREKSLHPGVQTHENAKFGDPGDGGGEGLAHLVRHKLRHIELFDLPLCVLGGDLPL